VTEGWEDKKIRAERFQRIGSSNVPALWGLRASIKLANDIGMDRIERRHRQMADFILAEMIRRGAESWTSPDPALRCGIVSVNVPPVQRGELENWLWKTHKIRIRGGDPKSCGSLRPIICRREILIGSWRNSTSTSGKRRLPDCLKSRQDFRLLRPGSYARCKLVIVTKRFGSKGWIGFSRHV